MAKKGHRRGYEPNSHRDHPGITISEEKRNGERVIFLRWREPLPGGRIGKKRAWRVVNKLGETVDSRTAAKPYAEAKYKEVLAEKARLLQVDVAEEDFKPDASWDELFKLHEEHLKLVGKRPKTLRAYKQAWAFVDSWRGRPTKPLDLTGKDLLRFAAHVHDHKNKVTGEPLSPHSEASIVRHFKAILNHGRKHHQCVRLNGETVSENCRPVVKANSLPVTLASSKLKKILDAALLFDSEHEEADTFPLLVFFMLTGARVGEVERLRWYLSKPKAAESWPDFEGERLLMYGAKTSTPRVVPFDSRPGLKRVLELLAKDTDTKAKPFVFGGEMRLAIRDVRDEKETKGDDGETLKGRSLKHALAEVRKNSGDDWALKDLRSTAASFLGNADLFGSALGSLADQLGHDYKVLQKHYRGQFTVPEKQRHLPTVEGVLGIADIISEWCKSRAGREGRVIPMRAA